MNWVDGHLDLGYLAVTGRDLTRHLEDHETGCISLPALRGLIRCSLRLRYQ
jgi:hypothetical protein